MELQELESMWAVYDRKLTENTRVNKMVLKQLLMDKPQKRLTKMSLYAILELVIPFIMLGWLFFEVRIRDDWKFWAGMFLFLTVASIGYYWSIRYFLMIRKIDISKSVTQVRKELKKMELYKLQRIKLGYSLGPFGAIGVFMVGEIPILSSHFTLPLVLILLVFVFSGFFRYQYGIVERFRKFKQELNELEELEKE